MKILDNVLRKMQETPKFSPISADTFHDWSIESGDIISIETDGEKKTFPVFSSGISWNGAARGTISCSGNKTRPTMRKQERAAFSSAGSTLRRSAGYADEKILEDRKELIAALGNKDGAPEDLLAGFGSYVRWDLKNNEGYAESVLFAQVGEKARAEIGVYAVEADGETKTLAEILADQIVLTSAVDDAKAEIDLKADEKNVEALDRRVVETEKATASLTTRMGEAETSLEQKAEAKTVTDLSGRVTKTETAQTELANRIGSAETSLKQKAESKTVTDLSGRVSTVETAQTEIANRVGDVESGLATKVSTGQLADELKNYALASALKNYLTIKGAAELYVTDDDVLAAIGTYIVTDKDGNKKTLAEILADQITLQGATKILGNLSVENGKIKSTGGFTTPGDIRSQSLEVADNYVNLGSNTLTLQGNVIMSADGINLGGNIYSPKQITSTTGAAIQALGA